MDTNWNLRWLFYLWVSLVIHKTTAVTFINEDNSFLQVKKWDVSASRGLGFRFKTFLRDALLLYMDDEGKSNFLRVELFQGKLRLTCSDGSRFGAMAVEVGDHLNDLQWHRVLLERLKGKTTVTLDNQSTSRSTIKSKEGTSLHIESPMYFGGLPPTLSANSVTQPSVLLLNRFVGCMAEIEMFEFPAGQGKRRKDILDQSKEDSKGIAPGCTDMCEKDNICQNNGTCLNKFTTIACDCTATGFRGKTCEEALPVLGLGQSDYVIFNRSKKAISTRQDRIVFRFKTTNQNASILQSGRGRDYVVIELHHGSLQLRWNLGSGEMYVHVREKTFSDDQWHSVDIKRNQRQLDMTLDGNLHVSRTFPGRFISFDLKQGEGDVRIGGVPTNVFPWKRRLSGVSFEGCLQEINFNGVDIVQGIFNGEEVFITRGNPRSSCEISGDVNPTTTSLAPSTPRVTTDQTTTEQSTAAVRNTKIQLSTSYTTKPMTTAQVTTSYAQIFSGNSVIPCSDDEDNCDSDDSGSGDNENTSGNNRLSSGDKSTSSSSGEEYSVTIPNLSTNKSSKKPVKALPTKEAEGKLVGEPEIPRTNCIGDDEDGCDKDDDSGQSSTETGSAESASPTTSPPSVNDGTNYAKKRSVVKKSSRKKWTLIAGIIVVGTLLVAFCIFAIWWLCKNKNDLYWNGMDTGSRDKCCRSEVTDV